MNRDDVKKRIGILAEKIMHEQNESVLLDMMRETEALVEAYITHSEYQNPPPSRGPTAGVA